MLIIKTLTNINKHYDLMIKTNGNISQFNRRIC